MTDFINLAGKKKKKNSQNESEYNHDKTQHFHVKMTISQFGTYGQLPGD